MQWLCVFSLLGFDILWKGLNAQSYRSSPRWPSIKAHFEECNGALSKTALSELNNPVPLRWPYQSQFSCGSKMAIAACHLIIEWPARVLNRNPMENMWNGLKKTVGNLTCHPSKKLWCSLWPSCQTLGMKLLHFIGMFSPYLSSQKV